MNNFISEHPYWMTYLLVLLIAVGAQLFKHRRTILLTVYSKCTLELKKIWRSEMDLWTKTITLIMSSIAFIVLLGSLLPLFAILDGHLGILLFLATIYQRLRLTIN